MDGDPNIPQYLKDLPQWILWDYRPNEDGEIVKKPRSPGDKWAASNQRKTWSTYLRCVYALMNEPGKYSGLGFCFAEGDDLVGIDLDKCLEQTPGGNVLTPWASEIVYYFTDCGNTWTEITPSGKGLHIWCHGSALRRGKGRKLKTLEIYDYRSPRYFTVTGNLFSKSVEIQRMQEDLDWLHNKHMQEKEPAYLNPKPYVVRNATEEELKAALEYISADDYDDWIKVGLALRHNNYPLSLWEWWSARSGEFKQGACASKWKTFNRNGRTTDIIGLGSIFHMAFANGYKKAAGRLKHA